MVFSTAASTASMHALRKPLRSSAALEAVRTLLREAVPTLVDDRHMHPDLQHAIGLVQRGALATAASAIALPTLD